MIGTIKAKIRKEYYTRIKKMSIEEYKYKIWREQGMKIGENVHIYSDIFSKEPYMISIGDNTTISGNVTLVTHDNSICKYLPEFTDTFGRISIGRNCFIGMGSMILQGVSIADDTIVAAGSVVTKSVMNRGCVVGGVPARKIGTVEELKEHNFIYGFNISGMSLEQKRVLLEKNHEKLVVR